MIDPMQNKVCLVTGATAGIGLVTAQVLAGQGATLVGVSRKPQKCAAVAEQIRQQTDNPAVQFLAADLSSQADIRRLAAEFRASYDRLDVLVNNAGAIYMKRQESVDGIEMTFALNHLGYFLLTHLLLDLLKASAPARIVNVSSAAHEPAQMKFDDLEGKQRYVGFNAYSQSKLANILFTYELARRLEGTGVTVNALHPGVVATDFFKENSWYGPILRKIFDIFSISKEKGAETSLYLAMSPEVEGVTGKYFDKKRAVRSSEASYDEAAAQKLWRISEQMTGVTVSG